MYVLYGGRHTRSTLVEMVMAEGGIAYELRGVDILRGEHRTPEYLAINPAGWVPALVTPEGETLYETAAINLHLAERHGLTQLAPRTDDPDRGRFLSGLFFLTDDLEPIMKRYFYPQRFVLRDDDAPAMRQRALDDAIERLSVIEKRLQTDGPFHLGVRYSLVDLTMAYWAVQVAARVPLENLPAVRLCTERVMARPALRDRFQAVVAGSEEFARMKADSGTDS